MKLIDSNIISYSAFSDFAYLRPLVMDTRNFVSAVSKVEVLGYHNLTAGEKAYFESVFKVMQILELSNSVIEKAIELRQQQKIKLGDSLIAASGLLFGLEVNTRNVSGFQNILGLSVTNPIT